jgi:hypothetical protein
MTKIENGKLGFGINDCPIAVYKAFKQPCQTQNNDSHAWRLKDLIAKEEAYNAIVLALNQEENERK